MRYKNTKLYWFYQKLKWWWEKHDVITVYDELDGKRGSFYQKIPNKNWWEQAEYRKL